MMRYLPNMLTASRLILALPLGWLILRGEYGWALGVGLVAGATDALDGYVARKLGHFSQFGAALDPLADKTLVTVTFLCMAEMGLIPWYVAFTIIARDLVIVGGALAYRLLIGPFTFGATALSKFNMLVQISFCVLLLAAQQFGGMDPAWLTVLTTAVLVVAVVSGLDYVMTWSRKALAEREGGSQR
jgi:cardiolipin synthase